MKLWRKELVYGMGTAKGILTQSYVSEMTWKLLSLVDLEGRTRWLEIQHHFAHTLHAWFISRHLVVSRIHGTLRFAKNLSDKLKTADFWGVTQRDEAHFDTLGTWLLYQPYDPSLFQ